VEKSRPIISDALYPLARSAPAFQVALRPSSLTLFLAVATHCVAASITHLISVEVIKGLLSTLRMWTNIAVMWIVAVIDVAVEVAGTMEPRPGSDEYTAVEPLGPIVSVWGAVVRSDVVIAIRANRFWSDIDRDLSGCGARNAQQSCNQGKKGKQFPIVHEFLLTPEKGNPNAKDVNDWERAASTARKGRT
jgi:hypothetical protein